MLGIDVAKTKLGLQEVKDRKALIDFFKTNHIDLDPSTTPWCAAFVNSCERTAGKPGNGKLNARSFLTYGTEVPKNQIQHGDILVFARGSSTWQGHVTYFDAWDHDKQGNVIMRVLGGNQSDSVCYSWYSLGKAIGIRRS